MSDKSGNALCHWLSEQTPIFEDMRRLSKEMNVEVAQAICATKEGYAWTPPCLGIQCAVKPPQCENDGVPIADAHTHNRPKEETAFSAADYLYALHKGMQAHCLISRDSIDCEKVNLDVFKAKDEKEKMRILAPLAEASTLSDRILKKKLAGKPYMSEQEQYENKMYEFYRLASEAGLIQKCLCGMEV